jgi:hypothetical protein
VTGIPSGSVQRCLFPGIVWLLAVGFLVAAQSFSPAARAVPRLFGWVTLVLASLDLLFRMRPGSPDTAAANTEARVPPARVAVAVGGIVLLVAGMTLVGIFPTVPVFILIALRWGGGRSLATSLLAAVLLTGLLWGTFGGLLRLELYPGLFFGGDW